MYRFFAIGVVLMWVSAMAALFVRDVWPAWTAQDAPPMTAEQFSRLKDRDQQFGIFNAREERVGTAWGSISTSEAGTSLRNTVAVRGAPLVPELRIETVTEFDGEGGLDSFKLDVFGVPMTTIKVHGERRGIYFPCELQVGPIFRQASLDASASRMIGDAFRPFSYLPSMKVGQSWRMQVLDPLAAAMRQRAEFTSIVARVTGKERIAHLGHEVECMVIETTPQQVKAWVAPDGQVIAQQVELPGIGKISIREESYDETARGEAKSRIKPWSGWNSATD